MRRLWPHEERFNALNFGFQPTWLILEALKYGARFKKEDLHSQELGISTLSSIYVNSNRDPKKGEPVAPRDFFYFYDVPEEERINPVAADCYFSLVSDGIIPQWCVSISPVDRLRAARAEGTVPTKNRAWIRKGVLLLMPKITGLTVVAPLAFVNGVEGKIDIIDVDSGMTHSIFIPNPSCEQWWQIDAEFQLLIGAQK